MRCNVCRKEYFTIHECSGELYLGNVSKPDSGFLLGYYIGEALRIFKLDRLAIRRIEHDQESVYYSIPIWYLVALLSSLILSLLTVSTQGNGLSLAVLITIAIRVLLIPFLQGIFLLVQLGIIHGLARWLFSGQGSYMRVLRPYLIGTTLPIILSVIPVIGTLIGGVCGLAIYVWIFEEVEGISRIQAIVIGLISGLLLFGFRLAIS